MEFVNWLSASAGDLTASAILVAIIVVLVFGVQNPGESDKWGRPWWVPGWTYRQCMNDKKEQKAQIDGYVDRFIKRVDELEEAQSSRRRARS